MMKEKTLAKFKMAQLVKLVIHEVTRSRHKLAEAYDFGGDFCV